jgi:hypothetical protein
VTGPQRCCISACCVKSSVRPHRPLSGTEGRLDFGLGLLRSLQHTHGLSLPRVQQQCRVELSHLVEDRGTSDRLSRTVCVDGRPRSGAARRVLSCLPKPRANQLIKTFHRPPCDNRCREGGSLGFCCEYRACRAHRLPSSPPPYNILIFIIDI